MLMPALLLQLAAELEADGMVVLLQLLVMHCQLSAELEGQLHVEHWSAVAMPMPELSMQLLVQRPVVQPLSAAGLAAVALVHGLSCQVAAVLVVSASCTQLQVVWLPFQMVM